MAKSRRLGDGAVPDAKTEADDIPESEILLIRNGEKTVDVVAEEYGVSNTSAIRHRLAAYTRSTKSFITHVPKCTGDECPMNDQCPYTKSGRCSMINQFLKSIYTDWTDPRTGLGRELNQIQFDRIGTHIIPLYQQLARFSMETSALSQTAYQNKQGTWMAYPQFGEIRSVITQLRSEMKDLKIDVLWENKFGTHPMAATVDEIMDKGRPDAYEDLVKRAEAREKDRKKTVGKKSGKTSKKSK